MVLLELDIDKLTTIDLIVLPLLLVLDDLSLSDTSLMGVYLGLDSRLDELGLFLSDVTLATDHLFEILNGCFILRIADHLWISLIMTDFASFD